MGGGESATISIFFRFSTLFQHEKVDFHTIEKTQSAWHVIVSKLQKVHSQSLIQSFRDAEVLREEMKDDLLIFMRKFIHPPFWVKVIQQ